LYGKVSFLQNGRFSQPYFVIFCTWGFSDTGNPNLRLVFGPDAIFGRIFVLGPHISKNAILSRFNPFQALIFCTWGFFDMGNPNLRLFFTYILIFVLGPHISKFCHFKPFQEMIFWTWGFVDMGNPNLISDFDRMPIFGTLLALCTNRPFFLF